MSPIRATILCAVLAAAASIPACALSAPDEGALAAGGAGGETTMGTGGGDASIDIAPDAETPIDPYYRYTYLCGDGCEPGGDSAECSPAEPPGPGGQGGAGGGGGAGGQGGAGDPSGESLTCQLVPGDDSAAPACGPAGAFDANGPCQSVLDCAAGLGCAATETSTGACRPYCCGNVEDCATGTYCAPERMQEAPADGEPILIPVCIQATDCELLTDACGADLTCTIVRADGTTSCVEPGEGGVGDPCPCAAGFVCSLLTNECKKLCHLNEGATDCGQGATCQGGSMGFPTGFGICVGGEF